MPDAAVAVVVLTASGLVVAAAAIRFGMLLGRLLGRRLDRHDEEESGGSGG
jgi:hypothetical protein